MNHAGDTSPRTTSPHGTSAPKAAELGKLSQELMAKHVDRRLLGQDPSLKGPYNKSCFVIKDVSQAGLLSS